MSNNTVSVFPRPVRMAPNPLGLYLRVGRNDHVDILKAITDGNTSFFGAVFDPSNKKRHDELKDRILRQRLDAVLDLKTQQLSLPGGHTDSLRMLPWAHPDRPHILDDFRGEAGRRLIASIGDYVMEQRFTQVLAPTHILSSANDPWAEIDADQTRRLHDYFSRDSGGNVVIIYSLAIPYSVFRNPEQRQIVINRLKDVPMSALWLKIDRFGSNSSATAAQTYIEAATDFHELGVPVIADHVGGMVGLSFLAFGAVGGIAHGITMGERFDTRPWRTPSTGKGFLPAKRVYFPVLDLFLKPQEAKDLLQTSNRAKGLFGCTDTSCCPRGLKDMLENRGRHFLNQRFNEVGTIGQITETLRPQRFLRPATDKAVAAAGINWEDEKMAKKMQNNRKRLDSLHITLGNQADKKPPQSFAILPHTRTIREMRAGGIGDNR